MSGGSDALAHALAGIFGGVTSQTATYPLLTVASRQQATKKSAGEDGSTFLDSFMRIAKTEGIFEGLFAGYSSAMIGVALSQGVYYYVYQWVSEIIVALKKLKSVSKLGMLDNIIVATLAGVATVLATNPIWVINTRMAVTKKLHQADESKERKTMSGTFWEILEERGIRGLWSGLVPALILVLNPIIQYVFFERFKLILAKRRDRGRLTHWDNFWLGAATKLIATFVTYPYLVLKTRLQVKDGANEAQRYHNTTDAIHKIAKDEGIAGFYRGMSSKLIHSVITAAILFQSKEASTRYTLRFLRLFGIGAAVNK